MKTYNPTEYAKQLIQLNAKSPLEQRYKYTYKTQQGKWNVKTT